MQSIKVQCPAKINLTLKVINKREDGFHNIESIMQTINLFDYLTISSDMLYWEEGNYDSITNENKPGYIKFDLLKDTLTEDDITSVQHLTGEYGDIYTMVTFYVVGYSDNENVMLTNILINSCNIVGIPLLDHLITNTKEYYSFFKENNI